MDYKTKQLINSLTQDILESFKIKIPILDMDDVVTSLGGKIQSDCSFSDSSVVKDGGSFKIIISPFLDERRRKFTIAHELGHLFLHMGFWTNDEIWQSQDNIYYKHRGFNSEVEYQANEFAAAFLMPQKEYLKIMEENLHGNIVDTSKIAEYFNVPIIDASSRGKFLGYFKK